MKKLIDVASIASIVIALMLIGYTFLPRRPAAASKPGSQFHHFPIGEERLITLDDQRDALAGLSPREQVDQLRDWLLFVAVSSSGLTAKELNESLFDLPPIRHGYMKPVANFDYGDTRSCYIGNGQVVALIPADNSDERSDRLARIVDEQRKNLGEKPKTLIVFQYELKLINPPQQQAALVTRREQIDVDNLFTSSAGYYESQINGLDDLNRFMQTIDDLSYVSLKNGLTLGGRKVKGHSYRGIRVEEIAALYKSEEKVRAGRNALLERVNEFKTRWRNRSPLSPSERVKMQNEWSALLNSLRQERKAGALVGSSGFSLDPVYDYGALLAHFNNSIAPQINRFFSTDEFAETASIQEDSLPEVRGPPIADSVGAKVQRAREALAQQNADPLFELLGDAASTGDDGAAFAAKTERLINDSYAFQAARYDGDLQGTETGMVLFYTDLLAKLWAMNYENNTPSGYIDEFRPLTAVTVPSLYRQEAAELSQTRLWFGPRDTGFQISENARDMLFARTSTRIYAASSNSLRPGVETAPNAESAAFLGWWDNHYDEVARFEPEYERLNQIMKWSLVVTWLNYKELGSKLSFLQGVPVKHGYWFSEWVRQRPLRYQSWDKINFYGRGFNKSSTEVLPQLESQKFRRFGVTRWYVGGVSLGNEEIFAARTSLSNETTIGRSLRRSNLDYAASEPNGSALKNLEGTTYKFAGPSTLEAVTTATLESGARLRGAYGEFLNAPIERKILRQSDGLNISTHIGGVPYGELKIASTANGFRVGWLSRDMDAGMMLGRRLSAAPAPAKMLALDPGVDVAISLPGEGGYLVKLANSERWLKATRASGEAHEVAARVSDFGEYTQTYNLEWVKLEDVATALRNNRTLRFRKIENADNRYALDIGSSDAAGEPFVIEYEGSGIRGRMDAITKEISFAYDELPETIRNQPDLLRRLVSEANPAVGNDHYLVGSFNKSTLVDQVRTGDYRATARQLVNAPDQFKAELDSYLQISLAECQAMMRNEQFQTASLRLDDLIRIYGPREDLSLYKTISDLNIPRSTRNELAELVSRGSRPTLIDEINTQLKARLTLKQQNETLALMREGDDIALRYDVNGLSGSERFTQPELEQAKALIYVEDTPGLNNLDWQISPQRTLHAVLAGELNGQVVKLPRGDVARFRPTVILDKNSGVKYNAANTGGTGSGFRQPREFRMNFKIGGSGSGGFYPYSRTYRIPLIPCTDDDNQPADSNPDNDCDDEDDVPVIVVIRK